MPWDFGCHQYPRLQKLRKSTFGLIAALPVGFCPTAKSPSPAKFKIRNSRTRYPQSPQLWWSDLHSIWTNSMCCFSISTRNCTWASGTCTFDFDFWISRYYGLFAVGQNSAEAAISPNVSFCSRGYWSQPNSKDITKFLGQFWTFHIYKPFFILQLLLL